jgi:tetratricopeptide (TPR) repeat protein
MDSVKISPDKSISDVIAHQCAEARALESAGDYEAAKLALGGIWGGIGERPITASLQQAVKAEILLRAGALSGWLGSARQIGGAQEFAKDLISESIGLFETLGNQEKLAEAQTDLAICYWREGAFDEARVLFKHALANTKLPENCLRVLVNSTTVEISTGGYQQALHLLEQAAPLLNQTEDHALIGRYYSQRALALRRLGGAKSEYLDRSLIEYSAASFHFQTAGHVRYVARVENNIGFILFQLQRYELALEHLDRARKIFLSLKDLGSAAAGVNETRARVFLAQHRYAEAEREAGVAVKRLEAGGEHSLFAEALITQGIAFSRLGKEKAARSCFERAVAATDVAGDLNSSARAHLVMIEELQDFLASSEVTQLYRQADERLADTLNEDVLRQLRKCARIVLDKLRTDNETVSDQSLSNNLEQHLLHHEAQLIKRALDEAGGSITRAARALGLTHQGLAYIISTRHQKLTWLRRPVRTRRRSIMNKI